jgi:membrane protein
MMETVKGFVAKFSNDWMMNLASMLAYNILVAFFPLVLALLTILGFVLSWNHQLLVSLQHSIVGALPAPLQGSVDINGALQALSNNSGLLLVISLAGLLWAGSNLFGAMENCFDIIFRTRPRDFIPQKLMSFTMMLVFVVLAPIMFVASTLIDAFGTGAQALIPLHNIVVENVFKGVSLFAAVAVAFVLFLAVYVVVPNLPLSFRHAWRGALVSALLLVIANLAFPTYVRFTMGGSKNYGATFYLALIFVAWCWLFAVILLLGAEVNSYAIGMRAMEGDLATVIHRGRVHDQGRDAPPSHGGTAATAATRGERPAGVGAGAAPSAPQRPPVLPRASWAAARALGHAVGAVAATGLAVFWLLYRLLYRRARHSGEPTT